MTKNEEKTKAMDTEIMQWRGKIKAAIVEALMEEISHADAERVFNMILTGDVPHVTVEF